MKLKSYAKVNFILKVFPLRGNLHPIMSLIAKVDLFDYVYINLNNSGKTSVTFSVKGISRKNNTVYKAVELLRSKTRFKQGLDVFVEKRIPIMAGLGGGSSNAATVLKYLNNKLELNLTFKELSEIALSIGSDVASFLIDEPVVVSGYGDKVEKVDFVFSDYILILKPRNGISSKEGYALFDQAKIKTNPTTLNKFKSLIVKNNIYEIMANDLELPIMNNKPWIKKVYRDLGQYNLKKVILSGSGSSVLAFSNDKKYLLSIKSKLAKKYAFISINRAIKTR